VRAQAKAGKNLLQLGNGAPQLPARGRQQHHVVHVAHVGHQLPTPPSRPHGPVKRRKIERTQQGRQAAACHQAPPRAARIGQSEILAHQRQLFRGDRCLTEQPEHTIVADAVVVRRHVEAGHVARTRQGALQVAQGTLDAAVALKMRAAAVQRGRERHG